MYACYSNERAGSQDDTVCKPFMRELIYTKYLPSNL